MIQSILPQSTIYCSTTNEFPENPNIGDYLKVTDGGLLEEEALRIYQFNGVNWQPIYLGQEKLNGGFIYYYSDSMNTLSGNVATITLADLVTSRFGMFRVKKIGATELARSGATLQKRTPLNKIGSPNMVDWSSEQYAPVYDRKRDSVIFMNYLTNDVGLNYPDYNNANYEHDLKLIVLNLETAGWHRDNIKFVFRHAITEVGLNYTTVVGSGVTVPATMARYDSMAETGISVCQELGIQYFDFKHLFEDNPLITTEMDSLQRHSKNALYAIEAQEVYKNLYCRR